MFKHYSAFVLVFIVSGCVSLRNPDLDLADDALSNGSYQTALHYANKMLQRDSLSAEAFIVRGNAYSKLNESEKALRDFHSAVAIQPGFEAYYNRGLEYLKNESWLLAMGDFDKAISFDQTNSEAYFTRAYTKYLLDDQDGAIRDYKKVIELDSTSFKSYINIGNVFGSLGYGDQAIENFNTAISLQPNNPDGYFNRGNQKLIMDDLEGGIKDLEQSLFIDKRNVKALYLLAELKIKAGENLGAIEILNRILSIEENPKALFARGSIYLKLEDKNKACIDFNRAGELGYFDAYEMINKYCAKKKK